MSTQRSTSVEIESAKRAVTPVKRTAGRPSTYSDEIANSICDRLAQGQSLAAICRNDGIALTTVWSWLKENEEFRVWYGRAREIQAEGFVDELIEIADSSDKENAGAVRNRIEARRWVTSKILSKKYGDKPADVSVTTVVHNHVSVERQRQLQERMRAALES